MVMFESIFKSETMQAGEFFIAVGVALLSGIIFATMCFFRTRSTKSFLIATAFLPVAVTLIILLVNDNIGTGVAIVGAFSLVRFRSLPGTAKEICIIFTAMASGIAFGLGYLAYGAIFIVCAGAVMILLEALKVWEKKSDPKDKLFRITLPENLDYGTIFNDVFEKYASRHEILRVKTINLGSLFRVDYRVVLKDVTKEKEMLDELRCRNGNLEIDVRCTEHFQSEMQPYKLTPTAKATSFSLILPRF